MPSRLILGGLLVNARASEPTVLDDSVLPYGMSWDCPAFERACALARTLLGVPAASIIILHEGRVLRSMDPEGKLSPVGGSTPRAIERRKTVWTDDCRAYPEAANHPLVVGPPFIRFSAAAPIFLSDGSVLGALAVFGPEPKPYDANLRERLEDLAGFVADEADRARTAAQLADKERALRSTEHMLQTMFDTVPVSIMTMDREGNLRQMSQRFLQNIGKTREEADGRCVYNLHPAFENFRPFYDKVLGGETIHVDRGKFVNPDGTNRWLRSEVVPLAGEGGEIEGLISVTLDITEVVEALRRAEKAEQRMNLAAELADLHVWEVDYAKRQLMVGGAAESKQIELFGRTLTFDDLAGGTNITIHPDDREAIGAEWEKAVLEDRKFIPEYRLNRPDDKEVWAACSVKLTRDKKGNPRGLIGAMQNITARKQAEMALIHAKEDAEAATKAKSAFLATMSHEIRTPLNGVLGMAQAMEGEDLTPTQRERLGIIRQSGQTLLAILNDVLDISKIEAGKLELEEAEFDIQEVATGAHAAFTELANRKGLDFNLVIEPAAGGVYLGDSTRVRQVLYNLLSNAVKFTEKGGVHVRVSRTAEGLAIQVKDSGIGVADDRLESLFTKFEQADASTTRKYGGTGLGLSICRELAGLMGGTLSATSKLGEGTTMCFSVPLARVGDSRPKALHTAAAADEAMDVAELRVLAAEDNAVNQLVLKTLMAQAGIEVTIVDDGKKALEAWRGQQWDVILMDVQMPEMDGPTATRAIREEEAASGRPHTPIIALTANAMSHQVAEYRACGMDDFVAKPIEIGQLFAALERCLDEAETQDRMAS